MTFTGGETVRKAFEAAVDQNKDKKIDATEKQIFDPNNIGTGVKNRVQEIRNKISALSSGDKGKIKILEDKVLPQLQNRLKDITDNLYSFTNSSNEERKSAARTAAREIYRLLNYVRDKQIPNLNVEKGKDGKHVLVNKMARKIQNDVKVEKNFSDDSINRKVQKIQINSDKITDGNSLNTDMNKQSSQILNMVDLYSSMYAKTLHELNPDMDANEINRLFNTAKKRLLFSLGWDGKSFEVRDKQTLKKYLKNIGASDGVLHAVKGFLDLQTHQMNLGKKIGKSWDNDSAANTFRKNINEQLGDLGGNLDMLQRGFSFKSFIPTTERHQITKEEKFAQIETWLKENVAGTIARLDWPKTLGVSTEFSKGIEALQGGIAYAVVEDAMLMAKTVADPLLLIEQLYQMLSNLPQVFVALKNELGGTLEEVMKGNPYVGGRAIGHLLSILYTPPIAKGVGKLGGSLGGVILSKLPTRVADAVINLMAHTSMVTAVVGKAASKIPGSGIVRGVAKGTGKVINVMTKRRSVKNAPSVLKGITKKSKNFKKSTYLNTSIGNQNTIQKTNPNIPNNQSSTTVTNTSKDLTNSIEPVSLSPNAQGIEQKILSVSKDFGKNIIVEQLRTDPQGLLEVIESLKNSTNGFKILGLSDTLELDELIEVTQKVLTAKSHKTSINFPSGVKRSSSMEIFNNLNDLKGWDPELIARYMKEHPRDLAAAIYNMKDDAERMKLLGLKDSNTLVQFQKELQKELIQWRIGRDPEELLAAINKLSDEEKIKKLGLGTADELEKLLVEIQEAIKNKKNTIPSSPDIRPTLDEEWGHRIDSLIKEKSYIDVLDFRQYYSDLKSAISHLSEADKGTTLLTHFDDLAKTLSPEMKRELIFRLVENDIELAKKLLFSNKTVNVAEYGFGVNEYPTLAFKFAESGDQQFLHIGGGHKYNNFEEQYIAKLLAYYKKYSKQPKPNDFDINFLQKRLSSIQNSSQKLTPSNLDQN